MKAILKTQIKIGAEILEKGSEGIIMGVSNSPHIKNEFPNFTKGNGYYYIIRFPNLPDCLIDTNKVDTA